MYLNQPHHKKTRKRLEWLCHAVAILSAFTLTSAYFYLIWAAGMTGINYAIEHAAEFASCMTYPPECR